MDRMEWVSPARSVEVDASVLPSLADVDEIVGHIWRMPSAGARFAVFFAAIGFAGLRPSEAAGLRLVDVELPDDGWGAAQLRGAIPSPGTRYTDDGASRQRIDRRRRCGSSRCHRLWSPGSSPTLSAGQRTTDWSSRTMLNGL